MHLLTEHGSITGEFEEGSDFSFTYFCNRLRLKRFPCKQLDNLDPLDHLVTLFHTLVGLLLWTEENKQMHSLRFFSGSIYCD